ncbi:hypothetical protein Tco_1228548 [Tanacetum coccineum]
MSPTAVLFDVDTRTIYIRHFIKPLEWRFENNYTGLGASIGEERQDYTLRPKSLEETFDPTVRETASRIPSDGVRDLATASERSRLKKALEESTW